MLPRLVTLDFFKKSSLFLFSRLPFLAICLTGGSSVLALLPQLLSVLAYFSGDGLNCFLDYCFSVGIP